MANDRPPDDPSDRSSHRRRGRSANQDGLAALGRQMQSGSGKAEAPVANESGLRSLGAEVDAANGRARHRRGGAPRWSTSKKVVLSLCAVLVLLLAVVGGGYAYLWYRYSQITKFHISDEAAVQSGGPFTVLVIGSDTRAGESAAGVRAFGSSSLVTGQRSDVVQLWRVDPAAKTIKVLHIPRDTVVSMLPPDTAQYGTYNRINSAFNTGPNQLVKTITANFGIPINHVVQVDFSGFQDAVNALGGIYLNFPYPARDAYSGLAITTPGCQLLGGAQALGVARSRHYQYYENGYWHYDPTSDFGRIQRQDVFLKSLISTAKSKIDPLTVNAFIGSIHEGVTIDDGFGFNEMIGLALTYRSFSPDSLETQTLPTEAVSGFGGLGDVLTVAQPQAQQMLVDIFGTSLVTPTNPPPDAAGNPNPPPVVTPTTLAPTATSGSGSAPARNGGGTSPTAGVPAATTTTTAPPPSYNPVPCRPA